MKQRVLAWKRVLSHGKSPNNHFVTNWKNTTARLYLFRKALKERLLKRVNMHFFQARRKSFPFTWYSTPFRFPLKKYFLFWKLGNLQKCVGTHFNVGQRNCNHVFLLPNWLVTTEYGNRNKFLRKCICDHRVASRSVYRQAHKGRSNNASLL